MNHQVSGLAGGTASVASIVPGGERPLSPQHALPRVIPATDIADGDVYWFAGHLFQATDVSFNVQLRRAEWTAVWAGMGDDPGPLWHRYGSGGNEMRTITLADGVDVGWCDACFGPLSLCTHDRASAMR